MCVLDRIVKKVNKKNSRCTITPVLSGYRRDKIKGINLLAVKEESTVSVIWVNFLFLSALEKDLAPLTGLCVSASTVASAQTPRRNDANGYIDPRSVNQT